VLRAPELAPDEQAKRERALADARAELDADPGNADRAIWVGRRLGYLGRFREAIAVFTAAIAKHPGDARLYRHRGHRHITLRQFDRAIADLARAAELRRDKADEIEPDGMPNPSNIPTSTLHGNIYYHLALAHYLTGNFAASERDFGIALDIATNDDSRVAAGYWLYLAQRRQQRDSVASALLAKLPARPELLENHAYNELLRLFRAEAKPDELAHSTDLDRDTIGYGVAMWRLLGGEADAAAAELRTIVARGNWPAFGAIAAEAELARR
jgi:tetratricopeptide (TPR) repeat protein